jgi:hypothetical protein
MLKALSGVTAPMTLGGAIRDAIGTVTSNDCRAFFTAAGYGPE